MLSNQFEKVSAELNAKEVKNPVIFYYPAPTPEMAEEYPAFSNDVFLKQLATEMFGIDIIWDSDKPLNVVSSNLFNSMASIDQRSALRIVNGVPDSIFNEGYYPFANRGHSSSIVFKFIEGIVTIHLILPDFSIHELDVDLKEYMNMVVQLGGLDLFEIYLTKQFPSSLLNCHSDLFKERISYFFPNFDLGKFKHLEEANTLQNPSSYLAKYNYAERFQTTFNSIEEGYSIQLNPAKIQEIRRAELQSGYKLPPALVCYYLQIGYIGVGYIAPNLDNRESHGFTILPLEKVFNGNDNQPATFWNKDLRHYWNFEEGKGENLSGIHPFYINEYGTIGLGFGEKLGVYFINKNYEEKKLNLSIEDLLNEILNTRGLGNWQYCLANPSSMNDYAEKLIKVFPNADNSRYKK